MKHPAQTLDVVICGGGPVGMALALALTDAGRRCMLLDARQPDKQADAGFDPRTLALSYGSRLMLERLGVWNELGATPILSVHVSQQGSFGRTVLDAGSERVPALGYVVAYAAFESVLRNACASRVSALSGARVTGIDGDADGCSIGYTLDGQDHCVQAHLAAVSDGGPTGDQQQDGRVARDYGQTAIVADVTPAHSHGNRAWERFAKSGPIALLPKGGELALVWSVKSAAADTLAALPDAEFLHQLASAMGGKAGPFVATSPRERFPLGLRYRRELVGMRTLALGNAAQTLHPVAGQGLNLGLRDVWALTQAIAGCDDCGTARVLEAYAAKRRVDRFGTIRFTDLLARVFTVDSTILRAGRGMALTLFDVVPPARHFLARRMIFGASAWP